MTYVTSDIHGYPLDLFLRLLEAAGFGDADVLYVLGDVVDRNGDGGVAMLRWMMDRPNVKFILGNHEAMLLDCAFLFERTGDGSGEKLDSEQLHLLMRWLRNGSEPTMNALRSLKERDPGGFAGLMEYLRNAPLYAKVSACGRDFILVHSGLGNFDPGKKLPEYEKDELIWHRPFAEDRYFPDAMTVFGHTPTGYRFGEAGRMFMTDTWIDIDIGAASGGPPMLLRLDDLKAFYADGTEGETES